MGPTKLNRYHPDIVQKDFTISFIAGIMGGLTVMVLNLAIPEIQNGNYLSAGVWFLAYCIVGSLLYSWGSYHLRKRYAKMKENKNL